MPRAASVPLTALLFALAPGCTGPLGILYSNPEDVKASDCNLAQRECDPASRDEISVHRCRALSECLRTGWRGHPRDSEGFVRLGEGRCGDGDGEMCYSMAITFLYGSPFIPRDAPRGFAYFERACDATPSRCEDLALTYQHPPEGVAPDVERALAAYRRLCKVNPGYVSPSYTAPSIHFSCRADAGAR